MLESIQTNVGAIAAIVLLLLSGVLLFESRQGTRMEKIAKGFFGILLGIPGVGLLIAVIVGG